MKLRMLRNALGRNEGLGLVLFTVVAGIAGLAVAAWIWSSPPDERTAIGPVASVVLVVGWWLGPLLFGASDETLDTTRLALYPLPARPAAVAMATAAVIGPGPLAASLPLLALALRAPSVTGVAVGLAATAATMMLAITSSRWMLTALGSRLRRRRGRDLATVLAGLGAGACGLVLQALVQSDRLDAEALQRSADVVRWWPIGWPGDALGRLSSGELLLPLLELAATFGLLVFVARRWLPALQRALTEVDEGAASGAVGRPLLGARRSIPGPLEQLSPRVAAIAAKERRYLTRHPRYRVQVLSQATVLLVGGAPFFSAVLEGDSRAVLFGCIPGLTAGVSGSNLLGADGRALWAEWLALPSLRPVLRGRSITFAFIGIALAVVLTFVVAAVTGGWRYAPTAIGAGIGMSLAGAGVGAITSTLTPTPFPEDDNPNPFASGAPGSGCLNGAATMVGVVVGLGASLPILYGLGLSRSDDTALAVTVVAAPAYGALLWDLSTRFAGHLADRRASDLITAMDQL